AWRLREPDVPGDDAAEDATPEVLLRLVRDLAREVEPLIEHREQDALDLEARIQALLDEANRVEQLGEPFERVELALDRDKHRVGGRQRVERQEAERRRAVDEHVIVRLANAGERVAQPQLPVFPLDQLDPGPDQALAGWDDVEQGELQPAEDRVFGGYRTDEDVVGGALGVVLIDAEAARSVSLGVHVDDERASLCDGEARAQVDRSGRLPDPALLIGDGNDAGHALRVPAQCGGMNIGARCGRVKHRPGRGNVQEARGGVSRETAGGRVACVGPRQRSAPRARRRSGAPGELLTDFSCDPVAPRGCGLARAGASVSRETPQTAKGIVGGSTFASLSLLEPCRGLFHVKHELQLARCKPCILQHLPRPATRGVSHLGECLRRTTLPVRPERTPGHTRPPARRYMEARTRVVITGRVQGVGFRAWAVQQARTLGLRGWIRNRADGAVEAEMAGDPDAVARMRDLLAQGPPLARV